jgi:hypothetical protein
MRRGAKIGVVLIFVVAVLLFLDRVSVYVAQNSVASKLTNYAQFDDKPTVRIGGFPFLTQVVQGKYDNVEVKSEAVTVGNVQKARFDVHLRGMSLPLSKAFGGHVDSVPVHQVQGTVELSYADLSRISEVPGLTFSRAGNSLRVTGSINVPVVGTIGPVSITASTAVVSGGLKIGVQALQIAGSTVAGATLSAVNDILDSAITLPRLPFGLNVTTVSVDDYGLVIHGAGTNVVLRQS